MTKTLAIIIGLSLIFGGLSGCRDLGRTSVPNEQNFISAVGFDKEGEEWALSLRIAGGGEETKKILSASSETLVYAFEKIVAGSVGELRFSHCRAIVLGEGVITEDLDEAIRFCADRLNLPLSARLISADNAKSVITVAEDGNGYEISDILDKTAKELGFGAHTALYEIETARIQSKSLFATPRYSSADLQITGLTVYREDKPTAYLDMHESRVYAVLRNIFEGGEIGGERLKTAKTKMAFSFSNDRLFIDISLYSAPKSELLLYEVESVLSKYDTDIFGVELQLEQNNPEIYKKIKDKFEEYYKNAKFTVMEGD